MFTLGRNITVNTKYYYSYTFTPQPYPVWRGIVIARGTVWAGRQLIFCVSQHSIVRIQAINYKVQLYSSLPPKGLLFGIKLEGPSLWFCADIFTKESRCAMQRNCGSVTFDLCAAAFIPLFYQLLGTQHFRFNFVPIPYYCHICVWCLFPFCCISLFKIPYLH